MLLRTAICAAVLLLCQPQAALAQDTAAHPARTAPGAEELASRIDGAVAPYFQADAPGATVIVVKDGKTVLRKAYGKADVQNGVAMTPDTVLRLGSITKQFTAVGILMLMEEGKLALGDNITQHLPDYPAQGKKITIEHLLTHTSGIPSYTGKPGFMSRMTQDLSVTQMVDSFKNDPLEFEPGSRYRYNNSGYFLLGAIIEKISGQPYARFMEQRIFVPLGMQHTAYEGFERSKGARAAGHTRTDKGFGPSQPLSMSQPYAAGSLVSTVDDLARWDAALQGGKLLKPASLQRAFSAYRLSDGTDTGYGYGFEVGQVQGVPMVGHGGGINGFSTYALRLPEQDLYVVVLANSDSGPVSPGVVARKAAGVAIGKPYREFTEVALPPAALDGLAGTYEVEKGVQRVFRREGDGLVMQRTGRGKVALKPLSATEFFMPASLEYFEFKRDAKGAVTHVVQHTEGKALVQPRSGEVPAARQAVKIANAAFDTRVGRYELSPGFVLELTRDGDRYFAQATGQGKLEIFPSSDTQFFAREVDAEISFEPVAGQAGQTLVLKQGGRTLPGRRL